ncbi:2-methylcitrate dehydratase [Mucilaginibacter pineti]|uniref:2-methylcitrate dehydratase n=1 Tax=Mucilaginibacter pineti TaxID=1391627 RepID=A0A1G7H9I3_9SPHI|nr:MmgE/PrpD family protein [Mucilaginibacter pineti]SDE96944.1 2-methylcitrate dehydratase [Mucilaginibacter pineti]
MKKELQNLKIARFALNARYDDIGEDNIDQLKRHLLDALGSLVHASAKPAIHKLLKQLQVMGEGGSCKVPLIESLPYDRAAQLFTALIRYPDFMDNFMGKEATCHPSDNIGPLLAAAQFRPTSGKEFLTAMAVAYQIECRLVLEIPVMKEGIDHTLLLGYSMTAGIARLLGMTEEHTAHALGITGTSISPMVTSRASYTYEWKGFASSMDALDCVNICFLAREGLTGPVAIFEGPKGFDDVFGMKLDYDWDQETFELIPRCVLKKYNVEVHSQATLEAIDELQKANLIDPDEIDKVELTTFLTAYHIIGSGAYGDRQIVETKEQADHSLFYAAAVLLLDGEIYPEQYEPERIKSTDVQKLLKKIKVSTGFPLHEPLVVAGMLDPYTLAYPNKMKTKVKISLKGGQTLTREQEDYHGFFTRPFSWEEVIGKFLRLSAGVLSSEAQDELIVTVRNLDNLNDMRMFINMLGGIK